MQSRQPNRDCNLDLIRATAITMVVIYHVIQTSPIALHWLRAVTYYGQYGVDLFFVLSGWLIGGLYWRERKEFGNVLTGRFWLRRWIRTIPPYLVALLVSYLAVWFERQEPFDFGYLTFFQNYYERIPFFLVSWSLCIEEHFYLLLPLGFLIWRGTGEYRLMVTLLLLMLLTPTAFRFLQYSSGPLAFGFAQTATHLRMEGLILGFLLSYIATEVPEDFRAIARSAPYIILICIVCLPLVQLVGGRLQYTFWTAVVAVLFAAILVLAVSSSEISNGIARLVRPVALTSYSIYLVHPLALHLAVVASNGSFAPVYFPVALLLVAGTTGAFYFAIERTSIAIRDLHWPRRTVHRAAQLPIDLAVSG